MKRRRNPVFLVLDSLPAHKAKAVENCVAFFKGQLELHFLPTYAPDTNPDEFVWRHSDQTAATPRG